MRRFAALWMLYDTPSEWTLICFDLFVCLFVYSFFIIFFIVLLSFFTGTLLKIFWEETTRVSGAGTGTSSSAHSWSWLAIVEPTRNIWWWWFMKCHFVEPSSWTLCVCVCVCMCVSVECGRGAFRFPGYYFLAFLSNASIIIIIKPRCG